MLNSNINSSKQKFTSIKWLFFGTDDLAVIVLDELKNNGVTPDLIITTPDTPQGRKLLLTPPPVKTWAENNNIKYIQPANLKNTPSDLKGNNFNIGLVASYGKIIPNNILDLLPNKLLNIHPSLLPYYRGATPLESAILTGGANTGVTLMIIDAQMDHGPIVAQKETALDDKNYFTLRKELATTGAELFLDFAPLLLQGHLTPTPQNHDLATYTKKITKADGEIKLTDDPILNWKKYQAYIDWPGIFFFTPENKRIKITQAHLSDGKFVIDKVIPEGKKEVSWENFNKN